MFTDPLSPDNDEPDPTYNAPLLPTLALPVLSTNMPLTPVLPAFDVCTRIAPLLAAVPNPLLTDTIPPVCNADTPADKIIWPPDPLLPEPTVMESTPPRPRTEDPDPIYSAPLFPELELPVLNTKVPLTPAVPAFDVCTSNDPLLVAEPTPVVINTRPPVADADVPAETVTSPPDPLVPKPTVMYTEPPPPLTASPDPIYNAPLFPEFAVPDPMYKAPLLPVLELPVLSTSIPLTPRAPAFDVRKDNEPLLVAELWPVAIDIDPPVTIDDVPADNTISPPGPLLPDPTIILSEPPLPELALPDPM